MFRPMADASVVRHGAHSSDTGGPKEPDTTEIGRGGLLLVGVAVEPARPTVSHSASLLLLDSNKADAFSWKGKLAKSWRWNAVAAADSC